MSDERERERPPFLAMAKTAGSITNTPLQSVEAAYALALLLSESRLLPSFVTSWQDIVLLLMHGADLGFGPMESLRELFFVEGRVSISARAQLKLLKKHGCTIRWIEDGTNLEEASLELQLPGEEVWNACSYTRAEAERAGLWNNEKSAWKKHPAAMLRARCVTKACAMHAPHFVGVYERDELADVIDVESVPVARESFLVREAKADLGEALVNEALAKAQAGKEAAAAWWNEHGKELVQRVQDLREAKRAGVAIGRMEGAEHWGWFESFIDQHRDAIHGLHGQSSARKKVWDWSLKFCEELEMPLDQLRELWDAHDIWSRRDNDDVPSVEGV